MLYAGVEILIIPTSEPTMEPIDSGSSSTSTSNSLSIEIIVGISIGVSGFVFVVFFSGYKHLTKTIFSKQEYPSGSLIPNDQSYMRVLNSIDSNVPDEENLSLVRIY